MDLQYIPGCMLDCPSPKGPRSMENYITRNHQEEFVAAAKEEAGLAPMGSMETMECEAMVQDANLSIKQFNLVRTHVMHATGISFKMAY